jgi:hypothetical protein
MLTSSLKASGSKGASSTKVEGSSGQADYGATIVVERNVGPPRSPIPLKDEEMVGMIIPAWGILIITLKTGTIDLKMNYSHKANIVY